MNRSAARALLLAVVLAVLPGRPAAANPLTWPVVFQEVYRLGPREGMQLPLDPDSIPFRRFHLRIESESEIEVTVMREYGPEILWSARRVSDVQELIPWGRGERGTLSLVNLHALDIRVGVSIAVDPDEEDEPVHGFYVNRFLEALEAGESSRLLGLLDRALEQDPQDSVAARLVRRITGSGASLAEINDARLVRAARQRIDAWQRRGDTAAIDERIARTPALETRLGRRRWLVLVGRTHLLRQRPVRAMQSLYDALDLAPDVDARFEVYPLLVAANLAAGNAEQADTIVERALAEAPDDATRQRVRAWRADDR